MFMGFKTGDYTSTLNTLQLNTTNYTIVTIYCDT